MIAKTGLSDPYLIPDMVTLVNNFIWGQFYLGTVLRENFSIKTVSDNCFNHIRFSANPLYNSKDRHDAGL